MTKKPTKLIASLGVLALILVPTVTTMADRFMHEVLTPAVLEAQDHYYHRSYATDDEAPAPDELRPQEVEFIESRDRFYMGTVTENGWPYVQHRGGPAGFFKALGPREIAFADYGGNRQLVSAGSLAAHKRVSPLQQRIRELEAELGRLRRDDP